MYYLIKNDNKQKEKMMQKYLMLFLLTLFTPKILKAEFYSTLSIGTASIDDVKMNVNDNLSFTDDPIVEITEEEFGQKPFKGTITTTQTTDVQVALKKLVFASQNKRNLAFSGIFGYKFKNNLRVESEYRFIDFKTKLSGGIANANVHVDVDVDIKAPGFNMNYHDEQYINNLPMSLEGLMSESPGTVPDVSFHHNAHLQFFNVMYDANITEKFGAFAGAGLGFGFLAFYDVEYPEGTEVTIHPGQSRYFAYQYKLGLFYKLNNNIEFLISYTDINGINEANIGTFTYEQLHFKVVDFGVRYNFI